MSLGLRLTATALAVRRSRFVEALSAFAKAFKTRVEADGGTVESTDCLDTQHKALDFAVTNHVSYLATRYSDRVIADGGTIEDTAELTTIFTELNPAERG